MVPEGTTVPVGNVVAWIGKPGEKVDGDGAGAPAPKSQRSAVSGAREDKPAPAPPSASPRAAPSIPANPSPPIAPADATRVQAARRLDRADPAFLSHHRDRHGARRGSA